MSQCFRIQLKESVSRLITSKDKVTYPIKLTEILPEADMKDLLREALLRHGWTEEDGVFQKVGEAGETITLDLEKMEVSASLEEEREVSTEVEATGKGYKQTEAHQQARQELAQKAAAQGAEIEEEGTNALQRELTEALQESEESRQRALNEVLQEVYAESLKRKAGQLGDILEINESQSDDGNYELTIRVAQ